MARPADILDPTLRAAVEEAERLIDEGDYVKAAHTCAETYLLLLDRHPELNPPPDTVDFQPLNPTESDRREVGPEGIAKIDAARAFRANFWPPQGGIRVVFDAARQPGLAFDKERFSLSEAASYFEFLIQQIANAQRPPA